jgi:hypothetical protein
MQITRAKYEIYPSSETSHALIVKEGKLAKKINKLLKYYYPADTKFTDEEEPMFKFDNKQLLMVKVALGIKD